MKTISTENMVLLGRRLTAAIAELCRLGNEPTCAGPAGWSKPNSRLLQENLQKVVHKFLHSDRLEYPLNGSGLKLIGSWDGHGGQRHLQLNVGGDQANRYPEFVHHANALLTTHGFRPST